MREPSEAAVMCSTLSKLSVIKQHAGKASVPLVSSLGELKSFLLQSLGEPSWTDLQYGVWQKERLLECGWLGNNMGIIIYSFTLNISPKMSHGVLECDIQRHAYDSVMKRGCYLCRTLYDNSQSSFCCRTSENNRRII